jgi:PPM family protein phosphatase
LHIRYGNQSDQGRVRTSNEDSSIVNGRNRLFIVADGMGGHAAGEVASHIASTTVEEYMTTGGNSQEPAEALRLAAQAANARIYETQKQKPEYAGMGSTLTALLLRGSRYYIAQVGDSRGYLLRDGILDQLTRDHSVVWHLYENGLLRKEDLSRHPQKNLITRSIGPHPQVDVDIETGDVREGDVFLLCSDGLTDVLSDSAIRNILTDPGKTPQELGDRLVSAANSGGGPDNVTVVVVQVAADGSPQEKDEPL